MDNYRPFRIAPPSNTKQYVSLVAALLVAISGHKQLFGGVYSDWFEIAGVVGMVLSAWAVRRD